GRRGQDHDRRRTREDRQRMTKGSIGSLELGHVRLQVADTVRSSEFYRDVLGLTPLGPADGAIRLGAPDGTPLVELREKRGAAPVGRRGRLGLFHFAILLPDR